VVSKVVAFARRDWKQTRIRRYERGLRRYEGKNGQREAYMYVVFPWIAVGMIFGTGCLALIKGGTLFTLGGVVAMVYSVLLGFWLYRDDKRTGTPEGIRQTLIQYLRSKLQK